MAELVKLERAVSVRFPEIRARLKQAVDALCDADLQNRLWLGGQRVSPSDLGFDDTLLFLVDEMEMFGAADLIGDVLIDDSELVAFRDLVAAVESLIETIGKGGSFGEALATGTHWQRCVKAAHELQRRMEKLNHRSTPPPVSS